VAVRGTFAYRHCTRSSNVMNDMCLGAKFSAIPAATRSSPRKGLAVYLTKLRYEASASISFGPNVLATRGIGDSTPE